VDRPIEEDELRQALVGYGLRPDRVSPLDESGRYAAVFKADCGEAPYLVRVRHELATPEHVRFAIRWSHVVSPGVPVSVLLEPLADVPRVHGRCVDVAPFIAGAHAEGGMVGPEAWVLVGRWVGIMHRLGQPLADVAPKCLPYGNHPNRSLVDGLVARAGKAMAGRHSGLLQRAVSLLERTRPGLAAVRPRLPVGVVHGDMHFWNVLYADGMPVAIIDLDFLQAGPLVFDVAYASIWLGGWERERGGEWNGITERYIEAYGEGRRRAFTEAETEALPQARALTRLLFFLYAAEVSAERAEEAMPDLERAEEDTALTP